MRLGGSVVTLQMINLRAWPGRPEPKDPRPDRAPTAPERLVHHGALVLVLVAERGAIPERVGMGICLSTLGPTIKQVCLIVDDDLEGRDPEALTLLQAWAEDTSYVTPRGHGHLAVVTRSGFCDPDDGLILRAYTGGAFLLTADEGRTLGLLAEHTGAARGRFSGGFSLGLPGWCEPRTWVDKQDRRHEVMGSKLHRPKLRAKALGGHGLMAEWGRAGRNGLTPDGRAAGQWHGGRPYLGRIVDLVGPAFALDGIDTGNLAEHLGAFGLPALSVPPALPVSPEAAATLYALARAIHRLALALDEEAARWW